MYPRILIASQKMYWILIFVLTLEENGTGVEKGSSGICAAA